MTVENPNKELTDLAVAALEAASIVASGSVYSGPPPAWEYTQLPAIGVWVTRKAGNNDAANSIRCSTSITLRVLCAVCSSDGSHETLNEAVDLMAAKAQAAIFESAEISSAILFGQYEEDKQFDFTGDRPQAQVVIDVTGSIREEWNLTLTEPLEYVVQTVEIGDIDLVTTVDLTRE